MAAPITHGPFIAAGTSLGIGLGGFVDGIVFHQIFQLHGMLSARFPRTGLTSEQIVTNLEVNMFWDGLFHVFAWLMTCLGITLFWKASNRIDVCRSGYIFVGGLPLGWGLFNLIEGLINHHLLHLHHVTETEDHVVYDLVFLGFGVFLIVVGVLLINRGRREIESKVLGSDAVSGPRPTANNR